MELLVFKVKRRSPEYYRILQDLPQHGGEVWELPTYGEFTLDDDECLTTATKAVTWKGVTQGEVQRLADLPVLTPRDETRLWVKNVLCARSIRPNCPQELRKEGITVGELWKHMILIEYDEDLLEMMKGLAGTCAFKFRPYS